jgi:hypothetical protein
MSLPPEGEDEEEKKNGVVLTFPSGRTVDAAEIGASFLVAQSGQVHTPEIVDRVAAEKDARDREAFVQKQELYRSIDQKASASETVDIVLKEIAEELAHLKWERRKAVSEGKSAANYTISRIQSLRQLADVLLKRQENVRAARLDFKSPEFKKVLKMWMEFVYDSMVKSSVNDTTIDIVFKQMEADMAEWERKLGEAV